MTGRPEQWLTLADGDLRFAEVGLEEGFYSHVCFLCQQASEKALKSFLISFSGTYPRIHSVAELILQATAHAEQLRELLMAGRMLDQYYIPTRYPDGVPGTLGEEQPSETHARDALVRARKIVKACRKFVERQD